MLTARNTQANRVRTSTMAPTVFMVGKCRRCFLMAGALAVAEGGAVVGSGLGAGAEDFASMANVVVAESTLPFLMIASCLLRLAAEKGTSGLQSRSDASLTLSGAGSVTRAEPNGPLGTGIGAEGAGAGTCNAVATRCDSESTTQDAGAGSRGVARAACSK